MRFTQAVVLLLTLLPHYDPSQSPLILAFSPCPQRSSAQNRYDAVIVRALGATVEIPTAASTTSSVVVVVKKGSSALETSPPSAISTLLLSDATVDTGTTTKAADESIDKIIEEAKARASKAEEKSIELKTRAALLEEQAKRYRSIEERAKEEKAKGGKEEKKAISIVEVSSDNYNVNGNVDDGDHVFEIVEGVILLAIPAVFLVWVVSSIISWVSSLMDGSSKVAIGDSTKNRDAPTVEGDKPAIEFPPFISSVTSMLNNDNAQVSLDASDDNADKKDTLDENDPDAKTGGKEWNYEDSSVPYGLRKDVTLLSPDKNDIVKDDASPAIAEDENAPKGAKEGKSKDDSNTVDSDGGLRREKQPGGASFFMTEKDDDKATVSIGDGEDEPNSDEETIMRIADALTAESRDAGDISLPTDKKTSNVAAGNNILGITKDAGKDIATATASSKTALPKQAGKDDASKIPKQSVGIEAVNKGVDTAGMGGKLSSPSVQSKSVSTLPKVPFKAMQKTSPSIEKTPTVGGKGSVNKGIAKGGMVGKSFVPSTKSKESILSTTSKGVASLPKVPLKAMPKGDLVGKPLVPSTKSKGSILSTKSKGVASSLPKVPLKAMPTKKSPLPKQSVGGGALKTFSVPKVKGETSITEKVSLPLKGKEAPQLKAKPEEDTFVGKSTSFFGGKTPQQPEAAEGGGFFSNFGKAFFSKSSSKDQVDSSADGEGILFGLGVGKVKAGQPLISKQIETIAESKTAGSGLNASQTKTQVAKSNSSLLKGGSANKMKGEEKMGTASVASFKSKQSPLTEDGPKDEANMVGSKKEMQLPVKTSSKVKPSVAAAKVSLPLPLIEGLTAEEAEAIRKARLNADQITASPVKKVSQQVTEGQTAEEAEESRLSRLTAADKAAKTLKVSSKSKATARIGGGKSKKSLATASNAKENDGGLGTKERALTKPSMPLTEGLTAEEAEALRKARLDADPITATPKKKVSQQVTEGQTAEEAEKSRLSRLAAADEAAKTLKVSSTTKATAGVGFGKSKKSKLTASDRKKKVSGRKTKNDGALAKPSMPLTEGLTAEEAEAVRNARFATQRSTAAPEKKVSQEITEGQTAEQAEQSRLSRLKAADESAKALKASLTTKATTIGGKSKESKLTSSDTKENVMGQKTKNDSSIDTKEGVLTKPSMPMTEGLTAEEAEAIRNARLDAERSTDISEKKISRQATEGQTAEEAEESRLSRLTAADEAAKVLNVPSTTLVDGNDADKLGSSGAVTAKPLKAIPIGSKDMNKVIAKGSIIGVPITKSKGITLPTKSKGVVTSLPKVPLKSMPTKAPPAQQSVGGALKTFSMSKGKGGKNNEEKFVGKVSSPLKGKAPQLKAKSEEITFADKAFSFFRGKGPQPKSSEGGGFLSNFGKTFLTKTPSKEEASSPATESVPYGLGAGKAKSQQSTPFLQLKAKSPSTLKGGVGTIGDGAPYGLGAVKAKANQPLVGKMVAKSKTADSGIDPSRSKTQDFVPFTAATNEVESPPPADE